MKSLSHVVRLRWLVGLALVLGGTAARADQVWTVTIDTSQLAADYPGPFGMDFELIGDNGNTVTLSNFSFGTGGSAGPGSAFLTGGVSGDLGSSIVFNDNIFFLSDYNQRFTPGTTLSFTVDTTLVAPPAGGFPDDFSMVILSGYDPVNGYNPFAFTGGNPIPTTDPSGYDTVFNLVNGGPGATSAQGYASVSGDLTVTVTPMGASVPEPGSCVLLVSGIACTAIAIGRRRTRRGEVS